MMQSQNWTQYALDQPMKESPGQTFNYCNGASHLLSAIVQKTSGKSLSEFALEKFESMGINDMYWSSSPENVSSGYTGLYLLPDDAAKFDYLFLKKGNWNGKQLVPEKWVEESTKMQVKADWNPILPGYGYMWWINRFGGYAAFGQGGDYIFVIPELDLVVVFTGGIYDLNEIFYPAELMEQYIVPSVKSNISLETNLKASEALKKALDMVQNAPVPELVALPEIARKISGKPFEMDDSSVIKLSFANDNECSIDQGQNNILTIVLDNVYRIGETGNSSGGMDGHGAVKGRWLGEKTLEITTWDLENAFETVYNARFDDDRIEVEIKSNLGSDVTSKGQIK